jgi:hypothetical protein
MINKKLEAAKLAKTEYTPITKSVWDSFNSWLFQREHYKANRFIDQDKYDL